jgi:hypothetical protein
MRLEPGTKRRSGLKRLVLVLGVFFSSLLGLFVYFTLKIIPPITGRVVDATTGRAVRNVNVLLQASTYEGWAVHTEVRHRTSTNLFGWFLLPGVFHRDPPPLSDFRGSWLTVNEDQEGSNGGEEGSAATEVLYNPMFNRRGWPIGNKEYFPLTVTFRPEGCDRVWDATCTYRKFSRGFSIPLIPVLEHVEDCKKINDSLLQERCRQLNTYRAAFVHVDTYEEVQKGKELCNKVKYTQLSKTCLDQLALYIANPAYDRPIKPQVKEPTPEGMFPDSLAGVPIIKGGCGPRLEFSGRVMCSAGYGTQSNFLVAVYVEEWPGSEQSVKPTDWKPQYADHDKAIVSVEVQPGGQVLRYHGPQYNSFFWFSGEKHVEVFFYHTIPEHEQFVSFYLKQFPSTLR